MQPSLNLLRFALISTLLALATSCTSTLTMWHDKAYTPVVDSQSELVEPAGGATAVEQAEDLAAAADELYAQGYVLTGYSKFTHTLIPGFQSQYAKMYAKRIGAARVLQAEPKQDSNVYAYTVTYWAKGRHFPFGAYYNDIPDQTVMFFPDSLRAAIGEGNRPVLVEAVVHDSPAEAAGVKKGELIVAVDGRPIADTAALDALIPECANQEVRLTVWGLSGLRETTCKIGARFVGGENYGVEGLYYNQPWQFEDYKNFQQYSQAFTQAWNSGFEAYHAAQEQARRDAQFAYLGSEVSHLQGQIDQLQSGPSHRDSRPIREQAREWARDNPSDWYKETYGDRR